MRLWSYFLLSHSFWLSPQGVSNNAHGSQHNMAHSIQCMNVDYDLTQLPSKPKPRIDFMSTSLGHALVPNMKNPLALLSHVLPLGHTWMVLESESCLDQTSPIVNTSSCAPYSDMIDRFRVLEQCIARGLDDGQIRLAQRYARAWSWFQEAVLRNNVSPAREVMTHMVMAASRVSKLDSRPFNASTNNNNNNATSSGSSTFEIWREDPHFRLIRDHFRSTTVTSAALSTCMTTAHLSPNDLLCWSALMGAPGLFTRSLFDHSSRVTEQKGLSKIKTCPVPPVCGRLAIEKLHHFGSGVDFDMKLLRGAWSARQVRKRWNWKTLGDGHVVHEQCQVNPEGRGKMVCWSYTECLAEMLKVVCREHSQCCPSERVRSACVENLGSRGCKICRRKAILI